MRFARPASWYARNTSPEQSKVRGPVAPWTYLAPMCDETARTTRSAWLGAASDGSALVARRPNARERLTTTRPIRRPRGTVGISGDDGCSRCAGTASPLCQAAARTRGAGVTGQAFWAGQVRLGTTWREPDGVRRRAGAR